MGVSYRNLSKQIIYQLVITVKVALHHSHQPSMLQLHHETDPVLQEAVFHLPNNTPRVANTGITLAFLSHRNSSTIECHDLTSLVMDATTGSDDLLERSDTDLAITGERNSWKSKPTAAVLRSQILPRGLPVDVLQLLDFAFHISPCCLHNWSQQDIIHGWSLAGVLCKHKHVNDTNHWQPGALVPTKPPPHSIHVAVYNLHIAQPHKQTVSFQGSEDSQGSFLFSHDG